MTNSKLAEFLEDYGYHIAWVPALVATLGSLYFSEVAGFVPCTYCWYQRILMYPLVLVILVGIIKKDEYLPTYVLPFSIIGMGVSTYHYLMQQGIIGASTACSTGASCSLKYINWFGFVTIPFMALTAFTLITLTMGVVVWAQRQGMETEDALEAQTTEA